MDLSVNFDLSLEDDGNWTLADNPALVCRGEIDRGASGQVYEVNSWSTPLISRFTILLKRKYCLLHRRIAKSQT